MLSTARTGAVLLRLSLLMAIGKLVIAGEQAGFALEQMIEFLNPGLSIESSIDLISWRLEGEQRGRLLVQRRRLAKF
jgi:hypothetical protein